MSFRNWRMVKDPVDTVLAIASVMFIGAAVTIVCFALLALVFG